MQKVIVTDELIKEANNYFIDGNRINKIYVGPKNEYQKWYYIINKNHKNENSRKWRISNIEYDKNRSKIKGSEHRFIDKLNALRVISNLKYPKCCECGNTDIRVLTVNHINGDGAVERNNTKRISRIYRDIRLGRKVDDLEVKCYNCNILYEYKLGRRKLPLNWEELYGT